MRARVWCVAAVLGPAGLASAQLMIGDARRDRVMLFDAFDGSVVDLDWITDQGAVGWSFSTPKEARVVGREVWVSDQVADAVHRFTMDGAFIASITQHYLPGVHLENVRGIGSDFARVYVTTLGNSGTDRGVVIYNRDGLATGFYRGTGSYFDVEPFQGDLLVSSSTSGNIERWRGGAAIAPFATGLPTPQQVNVMPDGSVITVAAIASAEVEGVYHYNSDGTLRRFLATEALKSQVGELTPRGAILLGDGNYLLTTDVGVYRTVGGPQGPFTLVQGNVDAHHVVAMPGKGCPCDWNFDGIINSQDYFDYLVDFFGNNADFNGDRITDTRDFYDFLLCFFSGC